MRVLPFVLLAACAGMPAERRNLSRNPGFDGAWSIDGVELDATGDVATLEFDGRTYVFEGLAVFRGYISRDRVLLRAGPLEIFLTEERIILDRRGRRAEAHLLADLPKDRPVVVRDGRITPSARARSRPR